MKKLMLTTTLMAAFALPALPAMALDGLFRNEMTAGSVRASDLIGSRIYASEAAVDADEYAGVQEGWDDIGEVNDVVVSRDGVVEAVLVDIGGFLGMGERQVAVDLSALRFVADGATTDNADDWFLVMNANRATLEGAPEWQTSAMTTDGTGNATASDTATTTVTDGTALTDGTVATDGTANGTVRDGYSTLARTDLTADMLDGATAYDANDDNIGEVGDLVLATDGSVESIVIDVGGFLGLGAKPVALPMDQVEILRQTDGNDIRVYVSMTKDELEALPDYQM